MMRFKKICQKIFYYLFTVVIIFLVYLIFSPIWRETVHENLTIKGKFIHISDGYLYVQEFGIKTDRPSIVFIHGLSAWSEDWFQTIKLLKPDKYHMITIDIPPSGASLLHSSDYNWKVQGRRIKEVLDIMKIPNAILIGHSYGGHATLGAVNELGSRCKGIVLVSAYTGLATDQMKAVQNAPQWLELALKTPILRNALASLLTHQILTRPILEASVYDPKDITPQVHAIHRRALGFSGINDRFSDWLPEFLTPKDKTLASDNNFFQRIKIPTLIIWGDKDKLTPPWQANRFNILIEDSKLVLFPNVGHLPHVEEPEKFAFELEQFVQSIH